MKEVFIERSFQPETLAIIEKANELLEVEYADTRITARQVYYRFIGLNLIPDSWVDRAYNLKLNLDPDTKNNQRNYKHLLSILSDARLAGLIDWESIEDRGRRPTIWQDSENIREAVEDALREFRLARWKGQDTYVELWCEKDTLSSLLEPIAAEFHVPFVFNKGYSSSSALYDNAQRLAHCTGQFGGWAGLDRVPVVVLYVGDHDPSGNDMVRDLQERLGLFLSTRGRVDLEVSKVALTMEQVRRHRLPPNPARPPPPRSGSKKGTDSRSRAYIAEHGRDSWEVEALEPRTLQRLVRAAVAGLVDGDKMRAIKEEEDRQRKAVEAGIERALRGQR